MESMLKIMAVQAIGWELPLHKDEHSIMADLIARYRKRLMTASKDFWRVREAVDSKPVGKGQPGNRGVVLSGKQLDGLLDLLVKFCREVGIPDEWIYLKGNELPGYFRPSKRWDLVVVCPGPRLVAVVELKSQAGSFGNNFNNRTEEALGSAEDLWTAYREKAYGLHPQPWLGFLMLVEKAPKSQVKVAVQEPFFRVFPEFLGTSYLDRYRILGEKLMLERKYTQCCVLWTSKDGKAGECGELVGLEVFLRSLKSHLESALPNGRSTKRRSGDGPKA